MSLALRLLRLELEKALTYRFDFIVRILGKALSVSLISWFLWKSVYAGLGVQQVNGLSLEAVGLYYIAIPLTLNTVMGSDFASVSTEIYDGGLSRSLIYPRNFLLMSAIRRIGAGWIAAVPYLFIGLVSPIPASNLLFHFTWSTLAFPGMFMLLTTIDLLAFWFEQTWSLRSMLRLIILFTGGGFVPVRLFPEWLQPLAHALPFQSMIGFQTEALALGALPSWPALMHAGSLLLVWTGLFFVLMLFTWNRGLRSFAGSGL